MTHIAKATHAPPAREPSSSPAVSGFVPNLASLRCFRFTPPPAVLPPDGSPMTTAFNGIWVDVSRERPNALLSVPEQLVFPVSLRRYPLQVAMLSST